MTALNEIFGSLDWSYPLELLRKAIPALICVVFHEMAHGFTAYLLGDDTAKRSGRLSLNPLKHIDIFGLVMMAAVGFGWAKPVPVNMRRFRKPKQHMALTALAGPVSNWLIALVCLIFIQLFGVRLASGSVGYEIYLLLVNTSYLSICLGVFNLIPIPPLDGSKVLFSLLPDSDYVKLMRYERYGLLLCIAIAVGGFINQPLNTVSWWVFERTELVSRFIAKLFFPQMILLG